VRAIDVAGRGGAAEGVEEAVEVEVEVGESGCGEGGEAGM
jgi:hypothetical protein